MGSLRISCHLGMSFELFTLLLLVLAGFNEANHACESEVVSACPDRPGAEMAKCLKDKSEHERPTEISSECADFIALNTACAEDIVKFCDEAFFSDDTALCLSEWTPSRNLASKCASVVEWAVPKKDDSESNGPTDELGMSEKDYKEKLEWQAKRKAGRGAAVEKLREDKKSERELEALKKDDPAAYEQLLKEREEATRSLEELKRRKRLLAAAEERKQKAEGGDASDETEEEKKRKAREERLERLREKQRAEKGGTWLPYALGFLLVAYIFFNILNFFQKDKSKDDKDD